MTADATYRAGGGPWSAALPAVARGDGFELADFEGSVQLRTSRLAVIDDGHEVRLLVHGTDVPAGPASVVLRHHLGSMRADAVLDAGAPVALDNGRLVVGRGSAAITLDLRAAEVLPSTVAAVAHEWAAATPAWLLTALQPAPELADRIDAVCGALHGANTERLGAVRLGRALDRLIGYGPGLTPAGDDAVVGTLAVLHRWSPELAIELATAVRARLPRTTVYGRLYLRHASAGRFAAGIRSVLQALQPPAGCAEGRRAVAKLLDYGATSGGDTLLGIAAGLRLVPADERAAGSEPGWR